MLDTDFKFSLDAYTLQQELQTLFTGSLLTLCSLGTNRETKLKDLNIRKEPFLTFKLKYFLQLKQINRLEYN